LQCLLRWHCQHEHGDGGAFAMRRHLGGGYRW
jgi:hypothetical protein